MNISANKNVDWELLKESIQQNNRKALARCISLIENKVEGYENFLSQISIDRNAHIIGITGPPGAGKSTLTDLLIAELVANGKKIAVLCVDPSSPFHFGALLGDRIRMSDWYNHPDVFIRSMATRGSLGGLGPQVIEITDLLKAANFDYVIIETVGVGQSEVEIAGLADITIVVLVPEAGDEIQTMKAGLMEVADIFVVNKCDRPEADLFVRNLQHLMKNDKEIPVIKTIASQKQGIKELTETINKQQLNENKERKILLLVEKAYQLIVQKKMQSINKKDLIEKIKLSAVNQDFNLYKFVDAY
ncbi:MAG TPA: methylmalonyl Co-A mutase-associated GTPase MeaB [Puia sp.]|nr:methylmalonyl Co-A mutase-associated GTPase MeaB [Puia sp.]